jgi:hypothetical protein
MNKDMLVEDLRWLKPPVAGDNSLWIAAITVTVLLAIALLVWKISRDKKQRKNFFKPTPPHVLALRELENLRSMLNTEDDLEFVKKISRIVRVYIQERFGLRAPHRSTEEFLQEARNSLLLTEENRESLANFLVKCDLVKFALRRADGEQMKDLFSAAQQFIESTIPAAVEERP